ncbi:MULTISPECIES: DUF402 domain-containing protein [unclassified Corynebacterium]|uniref:DUF402 domain-containing protein n=1 Tax=unclassified Corynebacterium TaxID=2624378 RepID=UPI0029CA71B6|nr:MULTISPECIES: DUF402 domain-containing protein [unclassified Corynebacterium]WPF66949.1 DUF402 domain-containing protein [Corynebacterium sp. 22KM0430]WPF69437.1 DUF402 domain-containing protein [Corynebacterium sp. 21KM1197]
MSADLHPVKQETFDLAAGINIDPKGFERRVDRFEVTDWGLYMARGANHPRFGYLESWLLPEWNLRANIFHFRPGVEAQQHLYIDVARISHREGVWRTRDLYVDLVSNPPTALEVLDLDELAAATHAGLISPEEAELAMSTTITAVAGSSRHGEDPQAWLKAQGVPLSWAPEVRLMPAEE